MVNLRTVPIAAKMPLGIGLLLVLALGGMTWMSYSEVRRSTLLVATERLDSLSDQFSAWFEVNAQQRFAVMGALAREPALVECLEDPNASTCQVALDALDRFSQDNRHILAMEVWDAEGTRTLVQGDEYSATREQTTRAITKYVDVEQATSLGPFSLVDGTVLYRVVASVPGKNGVAGYVSELRRLTASSRQIRELSELLGSDARILVGTRDGLWHDFSLAIDGPPPAALEQLGTVEYEREAGNPVLSKTRAIEGGPWLMAIEFPVGQIVRPAGVFLRRASLVSLLIVIVGTCIGWMFSRRITQPLELVTLAAESVAAGRSGARVAVTREDELGRLQSSFNSMAGDVETARERLEGLARHYKLLFNESPIPMWVADVETGRFLDVNDAAIRHYGYSREEFLARTEKDVTVVDDAEAPTFASGLTAASGTLARHRLKNGDVIDVEITSHEVTTEERSTVLTLAFDVTERLAAEHSLSENESKLQQLNLTLQRRVEEQINAEAARHQSEQNLATTLDSIGDAVISTDAEGRIVRINPVAVALTGWPAIDARGRPLTDVFRVFDEETGQAVDSSVERVLREGVIVGLANRSVLIARNGAEMPISNSAAPIRDSAGGLHGVVVVFRDMSADRAAQRALEEKEARKSAVLEAAIDGIVTMDHRGLILEFNGSAERIFGISSAKAIGQPLADLIIPFAQRENHRNGIARYLATGENTILGKRLEVSALRGNGKEFDAEISVVRSGKGEPPVFTGFIRDVSERKQLEAQLRQSQKMEAIGQLAAGVAHDFNNLLSVIIGYTDLLSVEANDEVRRGLSEICAAGQRGAQLTHQLLAFSRQQVLQPQTFDLNKVISSMESMLRMLIGENIELVLRTSRQPGLVHADPGQVEQIVMNLVVNARDAMTNGGMLTIEVGRADLDAEYAADHPDVVPGGFVMLAVSDTGIGMDEATRLRVFEPFFTTKETGKGTGLGLSTVFGIVKQSGGSIWVYSELHEGTTFKVYLPEANRSNDSESARAIGNGSGSLQGRETVLLVEDNDQLRALCRSILERQGYRVLNAANGDDALRVCEHHPALIHLLLTDVVMPKMSGRQLADRLRTLRPETKTLFMSGYTDEAITQHGVLNPGVAFVQKPLTLTGLSKKVREVLDSR